VLREATAAVTEAITDEHEPLDPQLLAEAAQALRPRRVVNHHQPVPRLDRE
jgi:hypothetical protein